MGKKASAKLKQYDVLTVEWRDAYFDFDSRSKDRDREDYIVKTVGFLISDGPMFLSLAQEILPEGDGYRAVTHIPWDIVVTINGIEAKKFGH